MQRKLSNKDIEHVLELRSIPVCVRLVRAPDLHTDVVRLLLAQCCHFSTKCRQVQSCNLFVQFLGEQIHLILVCLGLSPVLEDIELSEHLVREGARHYEGGVTCCTSQVAQAARC